MANKIETSFSGLFLDTKLKTILDELNKELIELKLNTKEDIASLFNKVVREYRKNLTKSLLSYNPVASGTDPDITKINTDYFTVFNDLRILYSSLENTRNLLTSNYNGLSGMILKLKTDIAETSSKIIDYKIQNTSDNQIVFSDSFFNLAKVDNNDKSYSKPKAFVDTHNNNIVLPLDKEATAGKVKRALIVEDSVGTSGNNQEVGGIARDNLKLALDNSIDTWFEFEQVGAQELQLPTALNLKLELEEEIFFNLLDIITVQMPNGSYPAILDIKGSLDGANFFDLKSLYLGETIRDSVGNSIIQLGENTENPNGGNILYFTPRKLKYISIKLIEDSSFFIRTSAGVKYRRAIGIRELKVKSQKFKNEGQFISSNFQSLKEIAKVGLFTKEYLPPNFKTTFNYFVSTDNGVNWDPISPTQRVKEEVPEILNYNIDYLLSSKKTDFPVMGVKLKAEFVIEEGEETTAVTSSYVKKQQTEFTSISPGTKSIFLQKAPFGEVHLYQTNYGSIGKDNYFKLPLSSLKELTDRYVLQLPINVYPSQSIQIDQEDLFIDNYSWSRVDEFLPAHNTNSMVYEFDYINNVVTFHKDVSGSRLGKKPSGDILFKLKRENVAFVSEGNKTVVQTNFPHDAIKENISVYSIDETVSTLNYKLRNLASVHRLTAQEVEGIEILTSPQTILVQERPFINGVVELSVNGEYSIDKKRGVIYTYKPLSNTDEVLINVLYKKKNPITITLDDGKLITANEIKKDNKVFNITIPDLSYAVDLGFKNIEERSILFTELPASMVIEVPYENIHTEFNIAGTSGKYAIDYKNGVLYLQNKIDGKLVGTLVNTNYFAEYNITYKIPDTDYSLFTNEKRVDFSDKFISDQFNAANTDVVAPSLLKVEYSYTQDVKESLTELFPFTTPFIMEYKIVTTPKETV